MKSNLQVGLLSKGKLSLGQTLFMLVKSTHILHLLLAFLIMTTLPAIRIMHFPYKLILQELVDLPYHLLIPLIEG